MKKINLSKCFIRNSIAEFGVPHHSSHWSKQEELRSHYWRIQRHYVNGKSFCGHKRWIHFLEKELKISVN
ncbi:MAG: hypothetical protein ABIA76_04025 [Candidatus Diapherotrites archaeon]